MEPICNPDQVKNPTGAKVVMISSQITYKGGETQQKASSDVKQRTGVWAGLVSMVLNREACLCFFSQRASLGQQVWKKTGSPESLAMSFPDIKHNPDDREKQFVFPAPLTSPICITAASRDP